MEEIWKDIENYEGLYQVSNWGRVKSLRFGKNKILKPPLWRNRNKIQLRDRDGNITTYRVATLVAKAFIPNPDNKPQIDHIIPVCMGGTDAVNNLRWVTAEENQGNPLSKKYTTDKNNKSVLQYSRKGDFIKKWDSAKEAGEKLNISRMHIGEVCRKERKTAGGFIWQFAS